jgi:hypothetical protein
MARTIFVKCDCKMADFSYADMSRSVFWHANLLNVSLNSADLTEADFSFANLEKSDLSNTKITDSQLQSALSVRDAKLPNRTLGLGKNLIKNGDANCNIPLVDQWQVTNGNITVMVNKGDRLSCQFCLQPSTIGATMSQRIDLVGVWDPTIWAHSKIEFQAKMSTGLSIELIGKQCNGTVLAKKTASKFYCVNHQ